MTRPRTSKRPAFTLIEMLVVVGIIALLIGILLPSLKAARNSARKARVAAQLNAIRQALESFKNDVGDYPESAKQIDPTDDSQYTPPAGVILGDTIMWGAQHLARGMVGRDYKGFVDRKKARKFSKTGNPTWWYDYRNPVTDEPIYESEYPREEIFLNPDAGFVRTATQGAEEQLGGRRPDGIAWRNNQLIIIDTFDHPVLYYKANPRGNILCDNAPDSNGFPVYNPQNIGIPYYNQLDNDIFTGSDENSTNEPGWRFGPDFHQLRRMGDPLEPDVLSQQLQDEGVTMPFARYVHDHRTEGASGAEGVVKPVNPDSYLLITAGIDGVYGTPDDINNFQER